MNPFTCGQLCSTLGLVILISLGVEDIVQPALNCIAELTEASLSLQFLIAMKSFSSRACHQKAFFKWRQGSVGAWLPMQRLSGKRLSAAELDRYLARITTA